VIVVLVVVEEIVVVVVVVVVVLVEEIIGVWPCVRLENEDPNSREKVQEAAARSRHKEPL